MTTVKEQPQVNNKLPCRTAMDIYNTKNQLWHTTKYTLLLANQIYLKNSLVN